MVKIKAVSLPLKQNVESAAKDGGSLKISDSYELKTRLKTGMSSFEVTTSTMKAHLDLGFRNLGRHVFNPYLILTIPRSAQMDPTRGITCVGSLFHYNPRDSHFKFRSNWQLKTFQKDGQTDLSLLKNFSFGWKNLSTSVFDEYDILQGRSVDTRVSVAAHTEDHGVSGFIEADFLNSDWFTGITYGLALSPTYNLKLFYLCNRFFEMSMAPSAFGAEYIHSSKTSFKGSIIPWAKASGRANLNFSENFGASFIFSWLKKAKPSSNFLNDIDFGLQLRINS